MLAQKLDLRSFRPPFGQCKCRAPDFRPADSLPAQIRLCKTWNFDLRLHHQVAWVCSFSFQNSSWHCRCSHIRCMSEIMYAYWGFAGCESRSKQPPQRLQHTGEICRCMSYTAAFCEGQVQNCICALLPLRHCYRTVTRQRETVVFCWEFFGLFSVYTRTILQRRLCQNFCRFWSFLVHLTVWYWFRGQFTGK